MRFKDVAGCEEEKEEVKEIIDYLKDPKSSTDMGARIPKRDVLTGGSSRVRVRLCWLKPWPEKQRCLSSPSLVLTLWKCLSVPVPAVFVICLKKPEKNAPCIVFIDEIDAVGRQRGAGIGGGNDEREQTLNQILVEMDGFSGSEGVIVMAATNRSDVLDPALLRPGRFDRKILVGQPDVKGREEILKVHARNKPLDSSVDLKEVAKQTPGFVGADLENLLNEAALLAAVETTTQSMPRMLMKLKIVLSLDGEEGPCCFTK